jgi:hypothetical protein
MLLNRSSFTNASEYVDLYYVDQQEAVGLSVYLSTHNSDNLEELQSGLDSSNVLEVQEITSHCYESCRFMIGIDPPWGPKEGNNSIGYSLEKKIN